MIRPSGNNEYYELTTPVAMPRASGYLWNESMMIHVNCRGYAVAQFMQPEPAKYSHGPNIEAVTFMQPEQPYYAHHPGRFVYLKDEDTGEIFSAPYEPVRALPEKFVFASGKYDVRWQVEKLGIEVEFVLTLPREDPLELWQLKVKNLSGRPRNLSIYPYFTVGYMSWMNQSGAYHPGLGGIVCDSVTPYQKYRDYDKIKNFRDKTFLLPDREATAWEVGQERFEGEGGLHCPAGVQGATLACGDARYEMPVAVLQYRVTLAADEQEVYRFLFGPANQESDIAEIRKKYFTDRSPAGEDGFSQARSAYTAYVSEGRGCMDIQTPDPHLDNYVNHWMPRQMYYHGITNRLSTDPQTRNYLQDNMGMSYIRPQVTRQAFLTALSQQKENGAMPDGIILHKDAQLKYINQVPHSDHCVWLPVCLAPYLDETGDYGLLDETVPFEGGQRSATVREHIDMAMQWLLQDKDARGLNYINQGDWCDPMNMVGYKGKGVSGWLTMATAYAFMLWADICEVSGDSQRGAYYRQQAEKSNEVINTFLWDGNWYARGITDDNVVFGISRDTEGRIFINPQGWSLLCGAADPERKEKLLQAVCDQLETPYGVEKLAPSYTAMRPDVGRVTQKHPGSAENGAVYNHAAAFYIYALYTAGESENAFRLLRKMLPGPSEEDLIRRGQLPVFIPNYYRGAYGLYPESAGKSSNLFNTGTIPWFCRCLTDGLFGLQGCPQGLCVRPQLPEAWPEARVTRRFRGAVFQVHYVRDPHVQQTEISVDGQRLQGDVIKNPAPGVVYVVDVRLPG